jgi:hypothetical protein
MGMFDVWFSPAIRQERSKYAAAFSNVRFLVGLVAEQGLG